MQVSATTMGSSCSTTTPKPVQVTQRSRVSASYPHDSLVDAVQPGSVLVDCFGVVKNQANYFQGCDMGHVAEHFNLLDNVWRSVGCSGEYFMNTNTLRYIIFPSNDKR